MSPKYNVLAGSRSSAVGLVRARNTMLMAKMPDAKVLQQRLREEGFDKRFDKTMRVVEQLAGQEFTVSTVVPMVRYFLLEYKETMQALYKGTIAAGTLKKGELRLLNILLRDTPEALAEALEIANPRQQTYVQRK